jgi:hypothetical protein
MSSVHVHNAVDKDVASEWSQRMKPAIAMGNDVPVLLWDAVGKNARKTHVYLHMFHIALLLGAVHLALARAPPHARVRGFPQFLAGVSGARGIDMRHA